MVIIQQQGGFRTSYDPATGKLVRIELWGRPEKCLNTVWRLGLMLRLRKKRSGPVMSNGRNDAAMSAEGLFQVEPVK